MNEGVPRDRASRRGRLFRVRDVRAVRTAVAADRVAEGPEPPAGLTAFYWHFARQAKPLFAALFVAGFIVALLDTMVPIFIGRMVTLVTTAKPETLFADHGPMLLGMALLLLFVRPAAIATQNLLANQAIAANVSNRIRWQNHWHVVRQSWAFFQNDFAGRIANRVMQTGPAIRETIVALINGVWYILVYGTSAALLLGARRPVAGAPGLALVLRLSRPAAPVRAAHARPLEGDVRVALDADRPHRRQLHQHPDREAVRPRARGGRLCARGAGAAYRRFHRSLRLNTLFGFCLTTLNATMVTGTAGIAMLLWSNGRVEVGTVAMAIPLTWQIVARPAGSPTRSPRSSRTSASCRKA